MIFRNILTCALALAGALSVIVSALGQQEAERQVQRDAAIGQTVRVRGHVNYSHNCSDVVPTAIAVIQAPQHGTLAIRDEIVRSTDAELGGGCVGSSGMGKAVYYSRVNEGPDAFNYNSTSLNGVVHVHVAIGSAGISGPTVADFSRHCRRCRRRLSCLAASRCALRLCARRGRRAIRTARHGSPPRARSCQGPRKNCAW